MIIFVLSLNVVFLLLTLAALFRVVAREDAAGALFGTGLAFTQMFSIIALLSAN